MNTLGFPILSAVIFFPLLGVLFIALIPSDRPRTIAQVAFWTAAIDFALSLVVVVNFDATSAAFQFVEARPWITLFGAPVITYKLGVDGISLWLIPLTSLLTAVAVLFSWGSVTHRVKEYYILMLVLCTAMLGVFTALDVFLFYVFWEAVLIPMYFLIGIWGGERRLYATLKFVLYTMAGSALMLATIVYLALGMSGQLGTLTFDVQAWYQVFIPPTVQRWAFLAFALAFAIKVPLFPFHTWLPDAHVEAPTAGSVILAGILLKMGTYGFLRFAMPLFPLATQELAPVIAGLAIVGILYGGAVAFAQRDIKSLIAYSSVSHLGFVMLGLFALNAEGMSGGVLQMVNHGLSTGALFLLVGMIYDRRHTRLMRAYGGLWKVMPVYAAFFLVVALASLGLPGLNGFVGEFLILLGAFQANRWWAVFATFGVVLAAVYMLWLFGNVFFGPVKDPENAHLPDLNRREVLALVPLVALIVVIGVAPNLFLAPIQPSVQALVDRVNSAVMVMR